MPGISDRAGEPAGGDRGDHAFGGFGGGGIQAVVGGQQARPECLGRLFGQVREPAVGVTGPGQPDPDLGQAEHPGEERAHQVHRLDAGDGQLP